MQTDEVAVECSGAQFSYAGRTVLERINLTLFAQKTHVFLGPSGSGKSTLLRALMGLVLPASGEVKVMGRQVMAASQQKQKVANRAVGYLLQEGGLFPHLSVYDNATLPGQLCQMTPATLKARLEILEHLVQFDVSYRNKKPHELSGGQQQRVCLMRALFLDPPLMLLDEPFSALDPATRSALQAEMKQIFLKLGKTVVLVTHDVSEAIFFADSISLFETGRLAQHGMAREVLQNPKSPWARNFISASVPLWSEALAMLADP
jgi:osmoprotectant transport system ATP-binding protein